MTDDPKVSGLAALDEPSGFEGDEATVPGAQAESVSGAANGHAPAAPASTPLDPLRVILTNESFPEALRHVADRLLKAEHAFNQMAQRHPDEFSVGEALTQFRNELQAQSQVVQQIGQVVAQLSQQRAVQEFLAERNARATALDLAIKTLPEAARTPEAIVAHAEAFLGWLKSGMQA